VKFHSDTPRRLVGIRNSTRKIENVDADVVGESHDLSTVFIPFRLFWKTDTTGELHNCNTTLDLYFSL
jgi:hypothetical protein